MRSRDLEQDGGLLVCNRCLRCLLVRESVIPREVDSNLWEAHLEDLELPKVLVEKITTYMAKVREDPKVVIA
jgi:hypothetical protein